MTTFRAFMRERERERGVLLSDKEGNGYNEIREEIDMIKHTLIGILKSDLYQMSRFEVIPG